MSSNEMWKVTPLKSCILAILEKRGGVLLESDLENPLKEMYGDYSESELNKALMTLENQGLIHVSWISKTRRRIQRMTKEMGFLAVGED
ncbi:MAG: ArsR family transcriptional regulator [Candidatus Heimdallarchaeaceae archaeon]